MPTPCKPVNVIKMEKKSHRTKSELAQRSQAEKALTSNKALNERPEVAKNPISHAEFVRIVSLLEGIEKNDALYEAIINRYCEIQAECYELKERRVKYERLTDMIELLLNKLEDSNNIEDFADTIFKTSRELAKITKAIDYIDGVVHAKRKMLFDIEKENIFTIASALRSIPKKQEKKTNKLMEALGGG